MGRFRLLLSGSSRDIERLARDAGTEPWRISLDGEGRWEVRSDEFDVLTSPNAVHAVAEERLAVLVQAAEMLWGYAPDVVLQSVREAAHSVGELGHVFLKAAPGVFSVSTATASLTVFGADGKVRESPPLVVPLQARAAAIQQREDIQRALRFCREGTWSSLYKAFELIQNDGAIMYREGWCGKAEANRFTGSANHQRASGDDARHAAMRGPGPTNPLTLKDATSFVRRLVDRWIEHRARTP